MSFADKRDQRRVQIYFPLGRRQGSKRGVLRSQVCLSKFWSWATKIKSSWRQEQREMTRETKQKCHTTTPFNVHFIIRSEVLPESQTARCKDPVQLHTSRSQQLKAAQTRAQLASAPRSKPSIVACFAQFWPEQWAGKALTGIGRNQKQKVQTWK